MSDDSQAIVTTADSPGPVHAILFPIDPSLQPPNVELPTVQPNQYSLVDDDAQVCSIIGDDELYASYVDRHIATYQLDGIESWPQVPNPDNHNVILTYANGNQTSISLGSISLDPGPTPDQYLKTGGIIYPIDSSGQSLLDATNTPNLTYIRNKYWDMARQKVTTDVFFAQIVAAFADDVGALGHAGEDNNSVTGGENDMGGTVPTLPDAP